MNIKFFRVQALFAILWLSLPQNVVASDSISRQSFGRYGICAGAVLAATYGLYHRYNVGQEKKLDALRKPYSINLMWINQQRNLTQTDIFPADQSQNYVNTLVDWAKKNPDSNVNLWFDGALVSSQAATNTQQEILDQAKRIGVDASKFALRDVRGLLAVQNNPEAFGSQIPVYFRVDLLRAIALYELVHRDQKSWAVYADFDLKPMTKQKIFDRRTLTNLNQHGFVMAKQSNKVGFENAFQIFTYNEQLLQATKLMLIDVNLSRAQEFSKELREEELFAANLTLCKVHRASFQENVFYSYPVMYNYLCQLRGQAVWKADARDLNMNAKILMTRSSAFDHLKLFPMPTKAVELPNSQSVAFELSK